MIPSCCLISRWLVRCMVIGAFLALAWLTTAPLHSQESGQPSVLAKIPSDAVAFVHIKASTVWKAEVMAGLRNMILNAGPSALDAFNKRFIPAPNTLESVAFYVLAPVDDHGPVPAVVLGFNETFDQAKVLKSLAPAGHLRSYFGQEYIEDNSGKFAIKVMDNRTLLISRPDRIPHLLSHEAKPQGNLAKHLSAAAVKPLYAAMDLTAVPLESIEVPEALQSLKTAKEAIITGDLGKELSLKAQLKFADATAATTADKAARDGLQLAREQLKKMIEEAEKKVTATDHQASGLSAVPSAIGELFALASLRSMDEFMAKPPLTRQGDSLVFEHRFDPISPQALAVASALLWGTAVPAVQTARGTTVRTVAQNNLKMLGIAMHNYHATNGYMPAAIYSKDGKKALLSWRVALLPYLEQDKLFKEFKLDEPWDSDHNKKLIAKMPDVFKDPEAIETKEPGKTNYQIFVGGGAGFRNQVRSSRIDEIADGTSNTIMIVTTADSVEWTKPGDIKFDFAKPLPKLGLGGKPANVVLFDGSVRALGPKTSDRTIKMAVTANGGELMPESW